MPSIEHPQSSHRCLDPASRLQKAAKIQRLLSTSCYLAGASVLDIGAGAGFVAATLADAAGTQGEVWGVDVEDERQVTEGFNFKTVSGTDLPFDGAEFDAVVSNHVIEHVGSGDDQLRHLSEIHRVLKPGGWCYLATPNRWSIIEPHFKLPFLSWLPGRWRSPYVRLARRGSLYDCNVLARRELMALIHTAGLRANDRTIEAMRVMADVEHRSRAANAVLTAPEPLIRSLYPILPTFVFLLQRPSG